MTKMSGIVEVEDNFASVYTGQHAQSSPNRTQSRTKRHLQCQQTKVPSLWRFKMFFLSETLLLVDKHILPLALVKFHYFSALESLFLCTRTPLRQHPPRTR